ncbi:glutaminase A [uncultured Clostridium sp.]|jgi:glutaminase|uniref:glutaminase A n=1 Tax=uncultured Clostridium sp. TaxID=59620 RepID=UPI00260DC8DC|nr:glutaminase A [uncultured Clostridium sp.]
MEKILERIVEQNRKHIEDGAVATYIPKLAEVDKNLLGVAIIDTRDGEKEYGFGDFNHKFAIESTSKVLTLVLAILDNGLEAVFDKIGTEPTHFAFNSILNMEIRESAKPTNPFINAGAIAVTSMIKGSSVEERVDRILKFMRKLANNDDIYVNDELFLSEKETGNINRSLAYYMEGHDMMQGSVDDILDVYFQQCSIEITAMDLARMGSVLANKGTLPWSGEKILEPEVAAMIKGLMTTCGLYDESGSFAVNIGIPSKSGVGGGIMAIVPNKMGIGIFGPALSVAGNSVAGMGILKDISRELKLDIFE